MHSFLIKKAADMYELSDMKFSSLKALVDFFQENPGKLEEVLSCPVELKFPLEDLTLKDEDRSVRIRINFI